MKNKLIYLLLNWGTPRGAVLTEELNKEMIEALKIARELFVSTQRFYD